MINLATAMSRLESNAYWIKKSGTEWTAPDFDRLKREIEIETPPDLRLALERNGVNTLDIDKEAPNSFLAKDGTGAISRHQLQILMSSPSSMIVNTKQFSIEDGPDSRVPLPMLFFGKADGGHTHLLMNGKDHSDRAVYVWERADDPWGTGTNARGLAKAGDDLASFLMSLRPWDEL